VSGLAQVQLPPDTDVASVRRKLASDLYYIERLTPWLDLQILLCTALHALGVPYRVAARLLGLPGQAEVQREMDDRLSARARLAA
jgi:lipopolysaccharide/colanic/teichoic acid biosynthesis glycosyltransferase